jgi:uncharacterized membrane protein YheB (UPF0754 family)
MLYRTFGLRNEDVINATSNTILSFLSSSRLVDGMIDRILELVGLFLEAKGDATFRELLKVTDERKNSLNTYVAESVISILKDKLPELLQTINIHQLVVNKVNSLEIERVENLLLIVIAKHLKWINIFGAFLGALIGLVQVIIRLF